MGRRALRRIDPSLDLSRHLKTPDQLPVPWDASALFGRRAPLEIEIGSGKGLFLLTASAQAPEHDFLGIEIAGKYARFAAARLAKAGRTNALVVHGDARPMLQQHLPDACACALHVYFPDPWWKKRHHKRRLMTDQLLPHMERVLQPGAALHFWTDVPDYFRLTIELIQAVTGLQGPFEVPESQPAHDLDYRTHFERRMRLHNVRVFRAEFRKQP